MCSDPGQELIQQDIRDHRLEPHRRGLLFAPAARAHLPSRHGRGAGSTPSYFQMVNIRENVSWVHTKTARRPRRRPRISFAPPSPGWPFTRLWSASRSPSTRTSWSSGGGIAGIHAALTLANAGKKVYLVEREPTIGGHMAMFDKTFPTLDCAACILTPKMSAVKTHPQHHAVDLLGSHAGGRVRGQLQSQGQAQASLHQTRTSASDAWHASKPACSRSAQFPDEFNQGLSKRKPVYIPFPQATPQVVLIDPETCIQFKSGKCKKTCVEACDRKAIDFKQTGGVRGHRGRHHHPGDGLSRSSTPAACRTTATGSIPTSTPPWRSSGWSTPPDRPAAKSSCATAGSPRRSGSSIASGRATKRPTAGAPGSAACIL